MCVRVCVCVFYKKEAQKTKTKTEDRGKRRIRRDSKKFEEIRKRENGDRVRQ